MDKTYLLAFIAIFCWNLINSQGKSEMDSLLNSIGLTENSKGIIKTKQGQRIIEYGQNCLLLLADFFTDSTKTNIKSECQNRNLTKGEIAIILADRIETMPYATLTGVQNCLLTYCENNPNLIEYYLWAINTGRNMAFQKKYINWLYSKDRLDWPIELKGKLRRERKREIRKVKRIKTFANNTYN